VRVLLVATYELGHQPVNLARPAALLRARGHDVRALDTSVDCWDPAAVDWADVVGFSVPMHTATRLTRELAAGIEAPTCCYGLYAHMCSDVVDRVIGGEYEAALVDWVEHPHPGATIELGRAAPSGGENVVPDRGSLPPLDRYAALSERGVLRLVGAVEASRGCAHRCRHCPVPVVYDGRVRVAAEEAVLADVAQLVDRGATHITFGDPDFLNAPHHARRVVDAVHATHPGLTFDCTVKVEHVLRHRDVWPRFADAGCLFVVSAFESVDDATLSRLDKGHTTADAAEAVGVLRGHGIDVRPSFLPFTPWTTRAQVVALLDFVDAHDLVGSVDPVQYTIRLLVPRGSLLLSHPDLAPHLGDWDPARLTYTWHAADPAMDELQLALASLVEASVGRDDDVAETYRLVRAAAGAPPVDLTGRVTDRPRLTESWFCCAEPTDAQVRALTAPAR
jgi:radical SAM superfamily enzyme YgiQ (UPF0313 family)